MIYQTWGLWGGLCGLYMIGEQSVLKHLIFTYTNDARRYQNFVRGGGANLVINQLRRKGFKKLYRF